MRKESEINKKRYVSESYKIALGLSEYYCTGCGSYIQKEYGFPNKWRCSFCGMPMFGRIGSKQRVAKYYASPYFNQTHRLFEKVITDKGRIGEYLLEEGFFRLAKAKDFPEFFQTMYNVFIPEPNGSFQEIDCMMLCGRNIYVFECKNITGEYYADKTESRFWMRGGGKMYSPILQNEQHIAALKWFLQENNVEFDNIYNITVLGNDVRWHVSLPEDEYTRLILENCKVTGIREFVSTIIGIENNYKAGIYQKYMEGYPNHKKRISKKIKRRAAEELQKGFIKSYIDHRYNLLYPYSQIPESKRSLYLKEREARIETHTKTQYSYFYKYKENENEAIITRTNGVYYQYLSRDFATVEWHSAVVYKTEESELCWRSKEDFDGDYKTIPLITPLKLVNAYDCMVKGELFVNEKSPIISF